MVFISRSQLNQTIGMFIDNYETLYKLVKMVILFKYASISFHFLKRTNLLVEKKLISDKYIWFRFEYECVWFWKNEQK